MTLYWVIEIAPRRDIPKHSRFYKQKANVGAQGISRDPRALGESRVPKAKVGAVSISVVKIWDDQCVTLIVPRTQVRNVGARTTSGTDITGRCSHVPRLGSRGPPTPLCAKDTWALSYKQTAGVDWNQLCIGLVWWAPTCSK